MKIAIVLLVLTVRIAHADVIAIDVTLNGDQRTIVDETIAGTGHRVITFRKSEQILAAVKRDKRVVVVSEKTLGLETLGDKLAAAGTTMKHALPTTLAKVLAPSRAPLSIVFVLDRGHSMRGNLDFAKRVVRDVLAQLGPDDAAGVVTFESDVEIAASMSRDKAAVSAAVARVETGVGSQMFSGMRLAATMFMHHKRKHVIVISDGDNVRQDGVPELVDEMRAARMQITTVIAGPDLRWMWEHSDAVFNLSKETAAEIVQRLRHDRRAD